MAVPIMYSTHCPKCKVLEVKFQRKGVEFETIDDVEVMKEKGFKHAPQLEIYGTVYDFMDAKKLIDDFDPEVGTFESFVEYKRAE